MSKKLIRISISAVALTLFLAACPAALDDESSTILDSVTIPSTLEDEQTAAVDTSVEFMSTIETEIVGRIDQVSNGDTLAYAGKTGTVTVTEGTASASLVAEGEFVKKFDIKFDDHPDTLEETDAGKPAGTATVKTYADESWTLEGDVTFAVEKSDEEMEAVKIRYDQKLDKEGEVIEGDIKLVYASGNVPISRKVIGAMKNLRGFMEKAEAVIKKVEADGASIIDMAKSTTSLEQTYTIGGEKTNYDNGMQFMWDFYDDITGEAIWVSKMNTSMKVYSSTALTNAGVDFSMTASTELESSYQRIEGSKIKTILTFTSTRNGTITLTQNGKTRRADFKNIKEVQRGEHAFSQVANQPVNKVDPIRARVKGSIVIDGIEVKMNGAAMKKLVEVMQSLGGSSEGPGGHS